MPVALINNYPKNELESYIVKKDGTTLHGEIWLYKQFQRINEQQLIDEHEKWIVRHSYDLSTHPASKGKVEGQIDFVVLSKYGLLVIEVKGGGLRVNDEDQYFSFNKFGEYPTQNPFVQAKEYAHTLRELIDENVFVYRAVVFPHEAGFELKGPQLSGYENLFFSRRQISHLNEDDDEIEITKSFYKFLIDLAKSSRRKIIKELNPSWKSEKVNNKCFEKYPLLSSKQIKSLKAQLFPVQHSYGYNPERINTEIILKENYETLKGLRRNRKVIIQGAPGTGKTVLAKKFLAENVLKNQQGIYYCANRLIKAKLEHSIIRDYDVSNSLVQFKVYSDQEASNVLPGQPDFIIFDEAQEYLNKGLFEFLEQVEKTCESPKIWVLYDPKQTVLFNYTDISFYTDFYIENGFTHYLFDENYRCSQSSRIIELSKQILANQEIKDYTTCDSIKSILQTIQGIINESRFLRSQKVVLIHSKIISKFKDVVKDFFVNDFEELVYNNINVPSSKIRFTTPIKYRGLENMAIYLVTPGFDYQTKVENYVAVTRGMNHVELVLWKI